MRKHGRWLLLAALVLAALAAMLAWQLHPWRHQSLTHTFSFKNNQPIPLHSLGDQSLVLQKKGTTLGATSKDGVAVRFQQEYQPGAPFVTVAGAGNAAVAMHVIGGGNPRPATEGGNLVFRQVESGVDLAYQSFQDHLKETVTLAKPVPSVSFALDTQHISSAAPDANGGVVLYGADNSPAFYLEPLAATDANGASVAFSYTLRKTGTTYAVAIIPKEAARLQAAHFPVTIDPTISWTFAQTSDYTISDATEVQVSSNVLSLKNNSGYATDNPYAYTNTGISYTTLSGFSQVLDATNQGAVQYQLSTDKTTWYWWNGSTWATATPTDYNQSNPVATVNSNIASFATQLGAGTLYVKAFLHATSTATPVAVDSFTVTYTGPSAPSITTLSPNNGPTAGGTNVTVTGNNFSSTGNPDATGGTITYTDSSGLNPRSSTPYPGGYTVHTFTATGSATLAVPTGRTVDYLVIAGGGAGGGNNNGGGGGAGGYLAGTMAITAGNKTVTVGAGGIGSSAATTGASGGNSVFDSITATGGGGGGSGTSVSNGATGGSGGGGNYLGAGGARTASPVQGNVGAAGVSSGAYPGGGGGGAGAAGSGNQGGAGLASSITGVSVTRGGGGSGGWNYSGVAGGAGGGGSGAGSNAAAGSGAPNTGGGGGGDIPGYPTGGSGGSGVVIVRYLSGTGTAPAVTVGGVSVPSVYSSPTTINFVAPAHAAGATDVVVTNPDSQSATLSGGYTYNPPLGSFSVSPSSVVKTGGNTVTITGSNFLATPTVTFGGIPAQSVTFVSPSVLYVTTPALSPGTYNVVVTNPDGQSATLTNGITSTEPPVAISSVSPNSGPMAGGTSVTITGVSFAKQIAAPDPASFPKTWYVSTSGSDTSGNGTSGLPYASLNKAINMATTGDAIDVLPGTYHAIPLLVSSVANCINDLGKQLTIFGSNNATVLECYASDTPTASSRDAHVAMLSNANTVVSNMKINFYPNRSTNYSNAIFGPTTGTFRNVYFENKSTTINWSYNYDNGGTAFKVINSIFNANGHATSDYSGNPTYTNDLFSYTPSNGTRTYSLTRTINTADWDINSNMPADLLNAGDPTILNPDNTRSNIGSRGGLYAWDGRAPKVTIGGRSPTTSVYQSSTSLLVTAPAHATVGPVDVVVTNPDGTSATSTGGYTYVYDYPAPSVTSISPTNGPPSGGTSVTISGTNFRRAYATPYSSSFPNTWYVSPGGNDTVGTGTITQPFATLNKAINAAYSGDAISLLPGTYRAVPFNPSTSGTCINDLGKQLTIFGSNNDTVLECYAVDSVGARDANVATLTNAGSMVSNMKINFYPNRSTNYSNAIFKETVGTFKNIYFENKAAATNWSYDYDNVNHGFSVINSVFNSNAHATGDYSGNPTYTNDIFDYTPSSGTKTYSLYRGIVANDWDPSTSLSGDIGNLGSPSILNPDQTRSNIGVRGGPYSWDGKVQVSFGGVNVTTSHFINSTTLQAIAPPHTVGTVDVVVGNPDGQTSTLANSFTYFVPPTVTGVTPGTGLKSGGDTIIITGTNFTATPTVTFGGVAATSVTYINSTTLSVVDPPHPVGTYDVTVTNPNAGISTLPASFTYMEQPPTVSAVSPTGGAYAGGTPVTITGLNFARGNGNGPTLSQYAHVWYIGPSGSDTTGDGSQSNPFASYIQAQSVASDGDAIIFLPGTYTPAPITTIPTFRQVCIGDLGKKLAVFGSGASTIIQCTGGTLRDMNVFSLSNPNSSVSDLYVNYIPTKANNYSNAIFTDTTGTYNNLYVENKSSTVYWSYDYDNAGHTVRIVNSTFKSNGLSTGDYSGSPTYDNDLFDANPSSGTKSNSIARAVTAADLNSAFPPVVPADLANTGDPSITNPDGTRSHIGVLGGLYAWGSSMKVYFGGVDAQIVSSPNSSTLNVIAPPHPGGVVDVQVVNYDGQSSTLTGAYTYNAPPGQFTVSPSTVTKDGGDVVTVLGSNFYPSSTVTFGGVASQSVTYVSSTTLRVVTPPQAAGTYNVVVTNPDSQTATLTNGITYTNPPPVISGVSPTVGSTLGGTSVTITGANFVQSAVTFGGVAATNVVVVNSTTITATAPAHAAGPVDVNVTNSDTRSTTSSNAYTYNPPPGSFTVTPSMVIKTGGTTVTISGSNFMSGALVTFGGAPAQSISYVDANTLSVVTPAQNVGTYNVVVTNPDGQKATLTNGITFANAPPTIIAITPGVGATTGGTNVTITGTNFAPGTLTIGGVAATNVQLVDPGTITATTPAHAIGSADVKITNTDGQSATLTKGFAYAADRYSFLSTPLNVRETEPGRVVVQAVDLAGNPLVSDVDVTLTLSTSTTTGFFARSLDEDPATRWNYNTVVIPAGSSQAVFYYKDNAKGSPVITVAGPGGTPWTQTEQIISRYRLLVTGVTNPVKAGLPSSVTIQAVDYTGQPLHDYTGTVHFTTTDAAAVIPPDYTITPDKLGGNTFVNGVTMVTQGTWCVNATDTVDPNISGSQCNIVVNPPNSGVISKLAFITPPSVFPVDGQSTAITVQAQDANSVPIPVTSDKSIHLYGDSGTGQFSLDGTTWSGSGLTATIRSGTSSATFYYRDSTLGQHHVTVSDDAAPGVDFGWTNDTQTATTAIGSAYRLSISTPSSLVAGQSGVIHISQQDSLGNDVPSLSGQSVYVDAGSGNAQFSYSGDFANDSVGIAHLTIPAGESGVNVYYRDTIAGPRTIRASDATPPNGDTGLLDDAATVTVTAGPVAAFGFTTAPAQVVAGALSSTVTAGLYDQFGNLATAAANTPIYLSGSQPGITFYDSAGSQVITSLTVPAGSSTANFTFRQNTLLASQVVSLSDNAVAPDGMAGTDDASQSEVITPGAATKYAITSAPGSPAAAGAALGPMTLALENQYGVVIPSSGPTLFYLRSTSSGGSFSLDGATYTPTIASSLADGQSTQNFFYKDISAGTATITVADEPSGADVGLTNATRGLTTTAAAATALRIVSSAQTTQAGQTSTAVTVRLEDQYGNVATAGSSTAVNLSSGSATMRFDSSAAGPFNGSITTATIPAGQQSTTFYYKDTTTGTPQITAGATGLSSGSQTETVTAGTVAKIALSGANVVVAGQASDVLTATAVNAYGVPVSVPSDTAVNLSTSTAATGRFDTAPGGAFDGSVTTLTILAGQQAATFYYKDIAAGTPVLSGSSSGLSTGTMPMTVVWGSVAKLSLSGGTTAIAGQATGAITVTATNAYNIPVAVPSNTTISLGSSATTGRFDTASNGAFSGGITSVTIPANQQSAVVYYRDTVAGSPLITASASGLSSGTQTETISWGSVTQIALSGASTATAGQASSAITVAALNAFGIPVPVASDTTVSLSASASTGRFDTAPGGTFDGTLTQVVIPSGQSTATLYYRDTTAGTPTITATYGSLHGTRSVTVAPGDPAKLAITSAPQTLQIGQFGNFTATLQDTFGNTVSSAAPIAIALSSDSAGGTFKNGQGSVDTTTTLNAGAATATFSYSDITLGQPSITIGATGLASGSQTVTFINGAVAGLSIGSAGNTLVAGQPSAQLTAYALNAYGQVVPVNSDTTINLTSTSATGRFDTAASGSFATTSVVIRSGDSSVGFFYQDTSAGSPTISAARNGLTTGTYIFNVSGGEPVAVKFLSVPGSTVAGTPSAGVTIGLVDLFGNAAVTPTDLALTLSDSESTAKISANPAGPWTSNPLSAAMPAGSGTLTFYYQDTVTGNYTLTATASGLANATQSTTITPAPLARLGFTTGNQTIVARTPSGPITLTGYDQYGNQRSLALPDGQPLRIGLGTGSTGGTFSASNAPWSATTSIDIPTGAASFSFYYQDSVIGSTGITVQDEAHAYPMIGQTITTTPGIAAKLHFDSPEQTIIKNTPSQPISISITDQYGYVIDNTQSRTVHLVSSDPSGEFSLDSTTWSSTLDVDYPSGTSTQQVYYRDSQTVTATLTASLAGLTGATQNILVIPGEITRLALTAGPAVTAGQPTSVLVQTTTADGLGAAVSTDTVIPLTSNTGGQFSLSSSPWVPVTSVTIKAGQYQKTLFYRNTTAGADTITATAPSGSGWSDGSVALAISNAAASKIALLAAPAGFTVGTPSGQFVAEVQDQFGNVVTSGTDRTLYLFGAAEGSFATDTAGPWTATSVIIPAGATTTAPFYYTDTIPGAKSITISDTAFATPDTNLTNATTSVVVASLPPSKLQFTGSPQTITAGQKSGAVTINAVQSNGQPAVLESAFPVALSSDNATGAFYATPAATTPITSVAILPGGSSATVYYKATLAASTTMTATAAGVTSDQQTITVTPDTATRLAFITVPQSKSAGVDSDQMRLQLQDKYGNAAPAAGDLALSLRSSSPTGTFSAAAGSSWSPIATATMADGSSDLYLYYHDTTSGTSALSVGPVIGTITPAKQDFVVRAGAGVRLQFFSAPQSMQAGQPSNVMSVLLEDQYGNMTINDANLTVYLSSDTAGSRFGASPTFTPAVSQITMLAGSGFASFYYQSFAAGSQLITASDLAPPDSPDAGLVNASQTETILAGAPDRLRLSGGTTTPAGQIVPLTLHLENVYGVETTVPSDLTVYLTATNGGSFSTTSDFSSTTTSVTLPHDTSTLPIYYRNTTAGASALVAADQASGDDVGLHDASFAMTVLPGSVSRLSFLSTAPNLEAGQPSNTLLVQAQDSFGNAVSMPGGLPVYLTSSSASGRFSTTSDFATTITQASVLPGNNTATFYYKDTAVGTPVITVSDTSPAVPDTGLADAIQTATITSGAVTKLVWQNQPTIEAGEAAQLTIQAQNAFNVPTAVSGDTLLYLDHTNATSGFSTTSGGPWNLTSLMLPAGQSSATVYYRSASAAADVLTAADTNPATPDVGITNAVQALSVVAGAPTQLVVTSPPFGAVARHTSALNVVEARNSHGAATPVLADTPLYLRSSSAESEFAPSTDGPWGVNYVLLPRGQSSVGFYYHDSNLGTPTITVSDNLPVNPDTLLANASQTETITAQVIDHLLVANVSTPQLQGSPSSVVVEAQDSAGYIIDNYAGTISFSASDADAIIPASYTFNPAVDQGIHTFTNAAAFLHSGVKSITATDTNGITGTQSGIIVNGNSSGSIAGLQFISPTPPLVANKGVSSAAVTIQAVDAQGRPSNAPPGGYPIHLTSTSGSGLFALSPAGPWSSSLSATIPANLNSTNVYYKDGAIGTPTITASDWVGGIDSDGITNATLQVLVRSLAINVATTLQVNNNSHYYEPSPLLFSKNANGDYYAQADFVTSVTDETSGLPVNANLTYTLKDPDGTTVGQQTAIGSSYTYHIQPIQGLMKAGNYTLTVTAADSVTGITGTQTVTIPLSGWKMQVNYDPNNRALGVPLPYTVQTWYDGVLTDAPNFSVNFRDNDGSDVTSAVSQHLSDLTHTGPGQYSGSIPTTGLLPTDAQFNNAYYLYSRIYDQTNQTQAEDNHYDIFFQNSPALAPRNFQIEKVVTSKPPAAETYDLKFSWNASSNATDYILYRTQNKNATLYSDPCTILQIQTGHRYGDANSRIPFCETAGQQNVGADDTTQWVEQATVNAPATSVTIPWSQLQTDLPGSTYYYLVRAENGAGAAGYSTMAVSVKKHFTTNTAPLTNIDWLALPYYTGNVSGVALNAQHVTTASDIVKDIEGGTGANTNTKISRVGVWSPDSQVASTYYTYNSGLRRWTGNNFTINPGDSVYLQAASASGFDWTVVGSDVVSPFSLTPNVTPLTSIHWLSIPYTSKYQTASDIVKDIEGSTVGSVGNDKNRYINRIAVWSPNSQIASNFYTYSTPQHKWTGNNFTINPGDGIYVQLSGGGLPLSWTPPLIINPY